MYPGAAKGCKGFKGGREGEEKTDPGEGFQRGFWEVGEWERRRREGRRGVAELDESRLLSRVPFFEVWDWEKHLEKEKEVKVEPDSTRPARSERWSELTADGMTSFLSSDGPRPSTSTRLVPDSASELSALSAPF